MQWPRIKPRVMMLIPGINMIWNLIIDYVLQQLEINVKLISSYSMHHYMVAYLLDFKGMLITHNPILRGAGDPCSDECACACTCLNITGWAIFFCFFISSPGLLVFASETRADVSESMCFIICTYFSSTPHKAEFYGVHELDFVTGCDTDLSLRGLISADQFVISFFFSFFFYLRLLL